MRLVTIIALVMLVSVPASAVAANQRPAYVAAGLSALFGSKYDIQIKQAVDRYWPDFPVWKAWKAQLFQESKLNPDAVSPVGARGLAQFMPGTWKDVSRELGMLGVSPNSELAIQAGAYYMMKLRRIWSSPRPEGERQKLAQASYNAGAGHILKAQRICSGAPLWVDIAPCLVQVTGPANAHETQTYVERIGRWQAALEAQ